MRVVSQRIEQKGILMIRKILLGAACLTLVACGGNETPKPEKETQATAPAAKAELRAEDLFSVEDAWVRAPLSGSDKTAAYMKVNALTDTPAAMIAVTSPSAETLELHTHIMDGTTMAMRQVDEIEIPAELRPMSDHIMLFGVDPDLKEGDTVTLEITILNGTTPVVLTVDAPVKALG
jgi:copper(I)-binding protein